MISLKWAVFGIFRHRMPKACLHSSVHADCVRRGVPGGRLNKASQLCSVVEGLKPLLSKLDNDTEAWSSLKVSTLHWFVPTSSHEWSANRKVIFSYLLTACTFSKGDSQTTIRNEHQIKYHQTEPHIKQPFSKQIISQKAYFFLEAPP